MIAPVRAQVGETGSISGTVRDTSGAACGWRDGDRTQRSHVGRALGDNGRQWPIQYSGVAAWDYELTVTSTGFGKIHEPRGSYRGFFGDGGSTTIGGQPDDND